MLHVIISRTTMILWHKSSRTWMTLGGVGVGGAMLPGACGRGKPRRACPHNTHLPCHLSFFGSIRNNANVVDLVFSTHRMGTSQLSHLTGAALCNAHPRGELNGVNKTGALIQQPF
eukprot:TRINITY_DN39355_c0_g1_i1.p2 TRINITY_DN39355_c0_g1~~TRINITY_DN39355_c0_g1_i1.p2  ORF type:complete len:116 (+),score=4.69 TRINITY_DN39355_c0_g1_i1:247-594(+)